MYVPINIMYVEVLGWVRLTWLVYSFLLHQHWQNKNFNILLCILKFLFCQCWCNKKAQYTSYINIMLYNVPGSPLNETRGGAIQHCTGLMLPPLLSCSHTVSSRLPRVRSWRQRTDEYWFCERPAYSL